MKVMMVLPALLFAALTSSLLAQDQTKTATGEGPSMARALAAAEHQADSPFTSAWGSHSCNEGTKPASQYGTATMPWFTCSIDYTTNPNGTQRARYTTGIGSTSVLAVATAKRGLTGPASPHVISWDQPVCSSERVPATQYSKETKSQLFCSVTYLTGSDSPRSAAAAVVVPMCLYAYVGNSSTAYFSGIFNGDPATLRVPASAAFKAYLIKTYDMGDPNAFYIYTLTPPAGVSMQSGMEQTVARYRSNGSQVVLTGWLN